MAGYSARSIRLDPIPGDIIERGGGRTREVLEVLRATEDREYRSIVYLDHRGDRKVCTWYAWRMWACGAWPIKWGDEPLQNDSA
jgi:hypothetical protein